MSFTRPKGRGHWMALAVLALAAALAYALYSGRMVVPDRFNPWAPLDVVAEPNFLTGYKLARARSEPARCLAALASTGTVFEPLPDRATGAGCGFHNAVRLSGLGGLGAGGPRLGAPLPLSCPMALSLFMWQRHSLQPAAQRYFGERVASLQHFGSYACRNVNTGEGSGPGASAAPRSRHATADAFDVAGFTLADGQRISVLHDWGGQGPKAQLLAEVHAGACRYFNGVLGPGYNAVHRDHFHLETGGFGMCR